MKIEYPLPCGCAGPKFVSMCATHQQLTIENDGRRLGVPDIKFVVPRGPVLLGPLVEEIEARLRSHPGTKIVIHLLPESEA